MSSLEEIREERLRKLELLKDKGINPYPTSSTRDTVIAALHEKFSDLPQDKEVAIAGRIMALRKHGGSIFLDLRDGTGVVQGYLKRDNLGDESFDLFDKAVDIGDFIDLTGTPFTTKRKEETVLVTRWAMLTKSLRPLPEKWHGIQDTESRYRKRYLDILFNEETRKTVLRRAEFWGTIRSFLNERGFLEVETPTLEVTTGGADARPFMTHHNALDLDVYLRISCGELWQKRLIISGFPKVFEIGRIFRNEGISAEHLQDYTQMEFYWAYAGHEDGMRLVEELYQHIAKKVFGTLQLTIGKFDVDLGKKWEKYNYRDAVKKHTGIDVSNTNKKEVTATLKELKVDYDTSVFNINRAIDALWKHCRKQISGPGFLVGVPTELSPLAKTDPQNPTMAERFQPIIAGTELGNGYSELNDPVDQRGRFEKQQALRDAGDEEAQMADYDFVEALEYGMPPTCGFGMSVRVFSFFSNKSVRETQIFPLMKPKE